MAKSASRRWRNFGKEARGRKRTVGRKSGGSGPLPPTAKQANYLRILATRGGVECPEPRSRGAAAAEITKLKSFLELGMLPKNDEAAPPKQGRDVRAT